MRLLLALLFFTCAPSLAFGQFGINFHQSSLPFIGLNYEIKDRLRPEFRIGVDNSLQDIAAEGIVTYDLLNKEDYEFYVGIGLISNSYVGMVIPIGVNIYPLSSKKFGFHIELAPTIGESDIIRGSWGIRYRFLKAD